MPSSTRASTDVLPIIDLAPFLDPDGTEEARRAVAQDLRRACAEIGFFYLVGHGISLVELEEALSRGRQFFHLPLPAKQSLAASKGPARFGYFPLGGASEYAEGGDVKERFSLTREKAADEPATGSAGRSQWPDESLLHGFRTFFADHIAKRAALTRSLVRAFALSLDLPVEYFDAVFTHLSCVLMFNYYPTLQAPGAAGSDPGRWSFSPHTDYGAFTLLLQDELGGLQVRTGAGEWVEVAPLPGSFVVNIGDMVAMWTNDLYQSSLHRVVNGSAAERLSLAFFTYPQGRTVIRALPGCTSADNPPRYRPVRADAYNRGLVEAARRGTPGISTRTSERLRS